VEEALMIEPTETESKQTLDSFCDAMIQIAREAETSPDVIHEAPVTTPVRRLDQTKAAREPDLIWKGGSGPIDQMGGSGRPPSPPTSAPPA
jgi:glycine dehydrogenase subunit 2